MSLPKGTRRELELAIAALKTAATHLKQARCGLSGSADGRALALLVEVQFLPADVQAVMRLASSSKRGEARRQARAA